MRGNLNRYSGECKKPVAKGGEKGGINCETRESHESENGGPQRAQRTKKTANYEWNEWREWGREIGQPSLSTDLSSAAFGA